MSPGAVYAKSAVARTVKKRFLAKAFPEPDLKYRSRLRAVASSATATYDFSFAGSAVRVEVTSPAWCDLNLRRKSFVEPT